MPEQSILLQYESRTDISNLTVMQRTFILSAISVYLNLKRIKYASRIVKNKLDTVR